MSDSPTDAFGDQSDRPDRPDGVAPTQLDTVWSALVEDLPPNQRAWLAASRPVTLHESTAIIAVADDFTRNQIEGRLRTRLEDALSVAGFEVEPGTGVAAAQRTFAQAKVPA